MIALSVFCVAQPAADCRTPADQLLARLQARRCNFSANDKNNKNDIHAFQMTLALRLGVCIKSY